MSVFAEIVLVIALIFIVLIIPSFWVALKDLIMALVRIGDELHKIREEIGKNGQP